MFLFFQEMQKLEKNIFKKMNLQKMEGKNYAEIQKI